jgi:hypothetical protein
MAMMLASHGSVFVYLQGLIEGLGVDILLRAAPPALAYSVQC